MPHWGAGKLESCVEVPAQHQFRNVLLHTYYTTMVIGKKYKIVRSQETPVIEKVRCPRFSRIETDGWIETA